MVEIIDRYGIKEFKGEVKKNLVEGRLVNIAFDGVNDGEVVASLNPNLMDKTFLELDLVSDLLYKVGVVYRTDSKENALKLLSDVKNYMVDLCMDTGKCSGLSEVNILLINMKFGNLSSKYVQNKIQDITSSLPLSDVDLSSNYKFN